MHGLLRHSSLKPLSALSSRPLAILTNTRLKKAGSTAVFAQDKMHLYIQARRSHIAHHEASLEALQPKKPCYILSRSQCCCLCNPPAGIHKMLGFPWKKVAYILYHLYQRPLDTVKFFPEWIELIAAFRVSVGFFSFKIRADSFQFARAGSESSDE
jgi:hypothetical protein